MKVLIIGSGGREHAIAWKLRQSKKTSHIYVLPGNAGTGEIAENIEIRTNDKKAIALFSKEKKIDLVVVTPDDALKNGLVDDLTKAGVKAFGPTKAAAQIEWSKSFAKKLMREEKIPTALYKKFTDYDKALEYLRAQSFPIVIKADGLALGKGVIIVKNIKEGEQALNEVMLDKKFGKAGSVIIIEEYLYGKEISMHAFCDGKTVKLFPSSQDHKRAFDGDKGPNTGGMGTITPLPWVTKELIDEICNIIVIPVLRGLKSRGRAFKGILYPGIMITKDGPKVIEFNARFGDPEAQSYMRLLKTDLLDIMLACIDGTLSEIDIVWDDKYSSCVTLASGGYPGEYKKGLEISGIDSVPDGVELFHAGTKKSGNKIVTNGGRVLGVTAIGNSLCESLESAYKAVGKIKFQEMHYRKDIGKKSLE